MNTHGLTFTSACAARHRLKSGGRDVHSLRMPGLQILLQSMRSASQAIWQAMTFRPRVLGDSRVRIT